MRIIVCGGRNYMNREHLYAWLDKFHVARKITVVIQGGAAGADGLAAMWAHDRDVPCETYLPKYDAYGRRAPLIRNAHMLKDSRPDAVVAFPGGNGTANMVVIARRAGVKVYDGANLAWR